MTISNTLTSTYALQAQQLSKRYAGRAVLEGVSLEVSPGTILGLIGRNGAGKTTLIRAMLGLIQPDNGEARVFGDPALQLTDATKSRLGYVPQQVDTFGWMTAEQMFAFVGQFYPRWDAGFVAHTLTRWTLPTNVALVKLSPGERQRVALIRALAAQPDLLVLDEPASALDPVARRELLREIATRAAESGTTVLFSTHIVSDLERVASHVAFMHGGRLILHDELDALKERHVRLHIPAATAQQLHTRLPGELSRRHTPGGDLVVVIMRPSQGTPLPLAGHADVRADRLSIEDLFVEVAQ
ncbi:MAG: ABC transporter ATP-binding protein [Rhodanobacteraceae bacterium]|nr:ABC transporter ATP-binding protein [Rhodanobacteraceae bacterium]